MGAARRQPRPVTANGARERKGVADGIPAPPQEALYMTAMFLTAQPALFFSWVPTPCGTSRPAPTHPFRVMGFSARRGPTHT